MYLPDLVQRIDLALESEYDPDAERRFYLGASIAGEPCDRALWYAHRWAAKIMFKGRILRIFDRGHKREERFKEYLEKIGATVEIHDPKSIFRLVLHRESGRYGVACPAVFSEQDVEYVKRECWDVTEHVEHIMAAAKQDIIIPDPKQFAVSYFGDHIRGHMDAKIYNLPIQGADPQMLGEFKTHNEKSFKALKRFGVKHRDTDDLYEMIPVKHYAQCQIYMRLSGYRQTLYIGENKNTDDIHPELVTLDEGYADHLLARLARICTAQTIPLRRYRSQNMAGCRTCDFRGNCWRHEPLNKNCRTCAASMPVEGGRWHCARWGALIPQEREPLGCDDHQVRTT